MKAVYIVTGFGILFLLNIASNFLVSALNIHFPAPLFGMIILTLLVQLKILPIHYIEDACKFLLDNIGLFFVPLLVGMVLYFKVIEKNAIPIIATIVISTLTIMCATGLTVDYLLYRKKKVLK